MKGMSTACCYISPRSCVVPFIPQLAPLPHTISYADNNSNLI